MTWYVVDGMDGSGKSTCAELLRQELESRGRRVLLITHPNQGCVAGRLEAAYLRKEGKPAKLLSTLFYVLDVLRSIAVMRADRRHDDFIFVRYIMAVAYLPERLQPRMYDAISRILPMPDVKILVDVDARTSMDRILERGEALEAFENMDDLVRTRESMLSFSDDWIVIDNTRPIEQVRESVSACADAGRESRCSGTRRICTRGPRPPAPRRSPGSCPCCSLPRYSRRSRSFSSV